MMSLLVWPSDQVVAQLARPLGAFLLALLILLPARRFLLRGLYRYSGGEETVGHIVLETLRVPSLLWCIAGAVQTGLELSIIPAKYTASARSAILASFILSLCLVLASVSVRALTTQGRRRGFALALSGLGRTLIRVVIFTCGAAAVLSVYNVNVTPILAALGVGGLAVALALQDTLANFFAGIHILIEEPISLGAVIKLSSGEEGVVTDIGWRTTRVRNGSNNIFVIPNTKITSGILINYNLPEARQTADVAVMVGFDADVDMVQRIAIEETRTCHGVLATPEPSVFFNPGVTPTHLQFTVVFSVSAIGEKGPVQSEVRLRIHRRLRAAGVPLPHPPFDTREEAPV
jgi:small-conductance mechanosensitive channel